MYYNRITELEGQLSHAQTTIKTLRSDSDNRRIELERSVREKDTVIQATKEVRLLVLHEFIWFILCGV